MSLLNGASTSVNSLSAKIKNPFTTDVVNSIRQDDFIDGFQFEERGQSGKGKKVKLNGSLMPHTPFSFGGTQNIVKDFYAGQTEPSVHVLGPREKELVITGRFKDKKYQDADLYGVATEIQQMCDAIRIRGNVLRLWMGEFQRYGILIDSDFKLKNLGDIEYSLTFDIIGFNAPLNGKFIEKKKEVPFGINEDLINYANEMQDLENIPLTVPASIADKIRELTNTVASAINIVTDFVDNVIKVTNDIRKAVQRALGLIKHVQNKIREYKNFLGAIDPFNESQALTGRYENASFYASSITFASFLTSFMQRYRKQFLDLTDTLPLSRYLSKEGDTLQTISVKFYNDSNFWKKIMEHNNLVSPDIQSGTLLQIPRL